MKLAEIKISVFSGSFNGQTDEELEEKTEEIDSVLEPYLDSIKNKLQVMGLEVVISE